MFISTNYDRTEQTAIEVFKGMYPLESTTLSSRLSLASDFSKSMFNPVKDTCLHHAIHDPTSTPARAIFRNDNLPDAVFQDKQKCPKMARIVFHHAFDMAAVHRDLCEKLAPQLSLLQPFYP